MTDSRAAVGFDRLPWLADEPKPAAAAPVKRGARDLVGWAVAATLFVAGVSYWAGTQTAGDEEPQRTERPGAVATVPLPAPRAIPSNEEVTFPPAPEVAPAPAPTVELPPRVVRPAVRKRLAPLVREKTSEAVSSEKPPEAAEPSAAVAAPPKAQPIARPQPLTLWPSRVSHGASGRLV